MTGIVAHRDEELAEAGAWLARLQREDLTEADGLEFERWLESGPGRRAAYRQALEAWQAFDACADEVLSELDAEARRRRLRPAPSRRWLVGGVGVAMAAGLAVAMFPSGITQQPTIETFATGKGERTQVALADGSTIDLNAETRLTVTYARSARRVVLGDGEAIFDVAHDTERPFTVEAANHTVRVLGTQFDVRNRGGELMVAVARGQVQVQSAAAGQAFVLNPGQRLEIEPTGVGKVETVDPQEALSWRAGRLVYREQPLADVVEDLNRQFVEQIEIGDPELGQIPITGVIVLDDAQSVTARLALMLPIRSVPSDHGLLLLRK